MHKLCGVAVAVLIATSVAACDQILVRRPEKNDLAGVYDMTAETREFLTREKKYPSLPHTTIELRADGRVFVNGLPDCVERLDATAGGTFLSGSGTWTIEKQFVGYGIDLSIDPGGSLHDGGYIGLIAIRHRSAPYDLEMTIGDPDSGERLRFARAARR